MDRSDMFTKCMLSWRHLVTKITLVYDVHVLAVHVLVDNLPGLVAVTAVHTEPPLHLRVEVKQGLNLSIGSFTVF